MKTEAKLLAARKLLETKDVAYLCRLFASDSGNHFVRVIEGNASPKKDGQSFGWEKVSGPNAGERVSATYAKKYWRNVAYASSSITVDVGADWLLARRNRVERRTDDGVTMIAMPGCALRVGKVKIFPGWVKGERMALAVRGKRTYHMSRGKIHEMDGAAMAATAVEAWARQDAHKVTSRLFMRDLKTTRLKKSWQLHTGQSRIC